MHWQKNIMAQTWKSIIGLKHVNPACKRVQFIQPDTAQYLHPHKYNITTHIVKVVVHLLMSFALVHKFWSALLYNRMIYRIAIGKVIYEYNPGRIFRIRNGLLLSFSFTTEKKYYYANLSTFIHCQGPLELGEKYAGKKKKS